MARAVTTTKAETTPTFTAYFLRLCPEEQYNLLSAVRGPDVGGSAASGLKRIVTGRVRTIVFRDHRRINGCVNTETLTEDEIAEVRTCRNALGDTHFVWHLRHAVEASLSHPIWGGTQQAEALRDALSGY